MFTRLERIVIAIMFALLVAGITLIVANALTPAAQANPASHLADSPCVACHDEVQVSWANGPHGQALTDPIFEEAWAAQGKPGACLVCHTTGYDPATGESKAEGVTCEACHGDMNADHPKSPMPVNRSPDLCGRCHSDTRFGWQDWQGSTHYQRGMDCAVCHDPHSASLKKVMPKDGSPEIADASQLCINCHAEVSMDFPYSQHHQKGVSCVQCHVDHLEDQDREAHTVPDHSFQASVKTCNTCHSDQMHGPTDEASLPSEGTSPAEPAAEAAHPMQYSAVTPEPSPVSPLGYAGLAGLVGLAAGMVLAPWLERFYHRVTRHHPHSEE
jgi:predicted CXXCH cytochrome family protein